MDDVTGPQGWYSRFPTAWLWALTACFFLAGDIVTTAVGLGVPGVVESNPVTGRAVVLHGVAAMVVLKVATMLAGVAAWRALPRPYALGVPLGLATLGVTATVWNAAVVAMAVTG
jgi:hypothetical protein